MFVKIFSQILDSSIANNYELRHFFEDMLKLADSSGAVDMTEEAISRRINLPLEKVKNFTVELAAPDAQTRTPTHDGRRIIRLDPGRAWGWLIVNYEHYRNIRNEEERRAYNRDAQRKSRDKKRSGKNGKTRTAAEIRAIEDSRQARYVKADGAGDQILADRIAAGEAD